MKQLFLIGFAACIFYAILSRKPMVYNVHNATQSQIENTVRRVTREEIMKMFAS